MSYSNHDLPDNGYEIERPHIFNASDIPNYHAGLEDVELIDQYTLINNKAKNTRHVDIEEVKPTYLNMPNLAARFSFDLTKDYDPNIIWNQASSSKIDDLLDYIKLTKKDPFENDFVTYRGELTKIMVTPYAVRETWSFGASKFKNTIFMCSYPQEPHGDPKEGNLLSFGGHRFEYYITSQEPDTMKPIPYSLVNEEYSCVYKSKLRSYGNQDIKLFYAAEMDCLDTGKTDPNEPNNFIEIKTTKQFHHPRQIVSFERFKLIKWWAQTYLVKIPKIVCGYKTDDHKVESMEVFDVDTIPRRCGRYWLKATSLNFLYDFLRYVQRTLADEQDPNVTYVFRHDSGRINCYKILVDTKFRVLPEWFIEQYSKHQ